MDLKVHIWKTEAAAFLMLSRTRSLDPILAKFSFGTKHLGDAQRRLAKSKGKPVATGTRLLLILDLPLKSTLQEALRKKQPILRSSNLFTVMSFLICHWG